MRDKTTAQFFAGDLAMRRAMGNQKTFEVLARFFKAVLTNKIPKGIRRKPGELPPAKEKIAALEAILNDLLERVEKRSGLNLQKSVDRDAFMYAAAGVLYSPKGPGAKLKWQDSILVQLADDVDRVKANSTKKPTDEDCCKILLKQEPYKNLISGWIKAVESPSSRIKSLRRQLSRGRKVRKTLQTSAKN